MPVVIPAFPDSPLYVERVVIESRVYVFRFDWSNRPQRWYMNIYDQDDNPLILGIKIVANWPLISRYHYDPRIPPGQLIAMDLESNGVPPNLYDLGKRVQLYYYTQDELLDLVP